MASAAGDSAAAAATWRARQIDMWRALDREAEAQAAAADAAWRKALQDFETLRAEQNASSKLVAQASKEDKPALVAAAQDLAARPVICRPGKAGVGFGAVHPVYLWVKEQLAVAQGQVHVKAGVCAARFQNHHPMFARLRQPIGQN
jgi:hypothetical protein